jgi:hypothetical protein
MKCLHSCAVDVTSLSCWSRKKVKADATQWWKNSVRRWWVCPACKMLQFQEHGKIHTRYPHPVRITGEEADHEPE